MMSEMFLENLRSFFKRDIEVISYVKFSDGIGGHIKEEDTVITINGLIRPVWGDENLSADKLTVTGGHILYCEKEDTTEDITESKVVVYRNQKYEVLFVKNMMNFDDMLQVNLRLIV